MAPFIVLLYISGVSLINLPQNPFTCGGAIRSISHFDSQPVWGHGSSVICRGRPVWGHEVSVNVRGENSAIVPPLHYLMPPKRSSLKSFVCDQGLTQYRIEFDFTNGIFFSAL